MISSNFREVVGKRDGEQSVVVKGALPKTLKLQFKILCVQKDLEMSTVLEELINQWIQAGAPVPKSRVDFSNQNSEDVKGYLPKSLKLQFKVLCTQKRIKMCSVLYELIKEWVQADGSTGCVTKTF